MSRKGARNKNPSMNLIPLGTVSSNVCTLESKFSSGDLHLIREGQLGHENDNVSVRVAHDDKGTHVLRIPADNRRSQPLPTTTMGSMQSQIGNNEPTGQRANTLTDANSSGAIGGLPPPTWNQTPKPGTMYNFIVEHDLTLEGLSDAQLAALSEFEYQQLLQREVRKHEEAMRERTIRARRQQQQLMREQHLAE